MPVALALLLVTAAPAQTATLDAITFADAPSKTFLPLREVAKAFDKKVAVVKGASPTLNGGKLAARDLRALGDGTTLVAVGALRSYGILVGATKGNLTTLKDKKRPGVFVYSRRGQKRVFINKKEQTLVAFQGKRKVLTTRVSTGRAGKSTPSGLFEAQAYKNKLHRSRLYDNVAMPWSVQIVGNIFVHGFKSVPGRAASSGCIRVPLTGQNPARWFYHWVEEGTAVSILGKWPKNV